MTKKLLIAILLLTAVSGCKKGIKNEVVDVKPTIEIGTITDHSLSIEQANNVAVLHSMYPNGLKRVLKKIMEQKLHQEVIQCKNKNQERRLKAHLV